MAAKRKEGSLDDRNKSELPVKRAKVADSTTVPASDIVKSESRTSDLPHADEERTTLLPGFLRLPVELRRSIYSMVLVQTDHPLRPVTKALADKIKFTNEKLEAFKPLEERLYELRTKISHQDLPREEGQEFIMLFTKRSEYLRSLAGLRSSFPNTPKFGSAYRRYVCFGAPALVDSALFAVSKQVRAEAKAYHFSKHTIVLKPKVARSSRVEVRRANKKRNKEIDIQFDEHSEEILAVARNIHITISLNKMWALKNKLQDRTDIKSLTVRFYSEAQTDRAVQMVLLAAQCLRQIPVRNKAKMAWISRWAEGDEEVACAELDDIEPSMLETWMKKMD